MSAAPVKLSKSPQSRLFVNLRDQNFSGRSSERVETENRLRSPSHSIRVSFQQIDQPNSAFTMNKQESVDKDRGYVLSITSGCFIVLATIVWPILFCIVTFALFFGLHEGQRDRVRGYEQIPTISETGVFVPERLIFTYGLHLEAVFLAILFMFIFTEFNNRISDIDRETLNQPLWNDEDVLREGDEGELQHSAAKRYPATIQEAHCYYFFHCCDVPDDHGHKIAYLNFWNEVLLVLGLLAAFFMSLVGTVTLGIEPTTHAVLAGLMFLTGLLHMVLFYYTIAETMGYQPWQMYLHRVCLFMTIPFNVICIVIIALMWVYCTEGICVQAAVDFIPALEYQTFVFLLAYIFRFYADVQNIHLLSSDNRCIVQPLPSERTRANPGNEEYFEETKEAPGVSSSLYTPYAPPPLKLPIAGAAARAAGAAAATGCS